MCPQWLAAFRFASCLLVIQLDFLLQQSKISAFSPQKQKLFPNLGFKLATLRSPLVLTIKPMAGRNLSGSWSKQRCIFLLSLFQPFISLSLYTFFSNSNTIQDRLIYTLILSTIFVKNDVVSKLLNIFCYWIHPHIHIVHCVQYFSLAIQNWNQSTVDFEPQVKRHWL